jgi:glycosyltransferase involved in cell wall biosynthesis
MKGYDLEGGAVRLSAPQRAGLPQDLVCLSHLRWDFVFQRPQHLMTRWAREQRVFYVEEPVFGDGPARMELGTRPGGVIVATPQLPEDLTAAEIVAAQRRLLAELLETHGVVEPLLWYYTPMALPFSRQVGAGAVVYDCMDELSAFAGAPPALRALETELLERADVVLTGGHSLYEAKRGRHRSVHAFPSSVDVAHFAGARRPIAEPADQGAIARPRLGFFGVIDERMDIALLDAVAAARPEWQLVLIGPVVKVDEAALPRRANIHYLGKKAYEELPAYLAGWDVALLPFALNESTRFISPTKTPEYLAAGRPVVSTPIRDVVRPYGETGLARIAATPAEFVVAVEAALADDRATLAAAADAFLAQTSWDQTFARMRQVISEAARRGRRAAGTMAQEEPATL